MSAYYMPSARRYATLVAKGTMTMDEASTALSEETQGGLTPQGAATVIADLDKTDLDLANVLDNTRVGLDRVRRQQEEEQP